MRRPRALGERPVQITEEGGPAKYRGARVQQHPREVHHYNRRDRVFVVEVDLLHPGNVVSEPTKPEFGIFHSTFLHEAVADADAGRLFVRAVNDGTE